MTDDQGPNMGDEDRDPYEHEYIDEEGASYHHYREYVLTKLLGMCGCYDTQIGDDIVAILECLNGRGAPYSQFVLGHDRSYEDQYTELILHMLDHAGLTDHGSSVRSSWIASRGQEVFERLLAEGPL